MTTVCYMAETTDADIIGIREAAEILDVTLGTMRRWDRVGYLRPIRLSPTSPRRYRRADIEALISA